MMALVANATTVVLVIGISRHTPFHYFLGIAGPRMEFEQLFGAPLYKCFERMFTPSDSPFFKESGDIDR